MARRLDMDLASSVLHINEILQAIFMHVGDGDVGSVLLTSKAWYRAMEPLVPTHPRLQWKPWSPTLRLQDSDVCVSTLRDVSVPSRRKLRRPTSSRKRDSLGVDVQQDGSPLVVSAHVKRLAFTGVWSYADMAAVLSQVRRLQTLEFHKQNLSLGTLGAGLETLAPAVAELTALTRLSLEAKNLSSSGMHAMAPGFRKLQNLQVLGLYHNDIRPYGARALASVLPCMTALTWLVLSRNGLLDEGVTTLAPAIQALPRLAWLNLQDNCLRDDAVARLVSGWTECLALKRLDFKDNSLSADVMHCVPESWNGRVMIEWPQPFSSGH